MVARHSWSLNASPDFAGKVTKKLLVDLIQARIPIEMQATALEKRDEALAVERMRTHLEGVQAAVERWDPEHHPVS